MCRTLCLLLLVAAAAAAQTALKFDVVSVKPCEDPAKQERTDDSPGRLHYECFTADSLIRLAFLVYASGKPWAVNPRTGSAITTVLMAQRQQKFRGEPVWATHDKYTIDAKSASPIGAPMMRGPMMQQVLRDRFHLSLHRETQQIPVYHLVVDKGGAKLTPMKDGACIVWDPNKPPPAKRDPKQGPPIMCAALVRSPNGGVDARGMAMPDLCLRIGLPLERDVIDKTGLTGTYDFHLEVSMEEIALFHQARQAASAEGVASDPGGSITSALRKIGLRLEEAKDPVEFLVIDRLEKPTGN